VREFLGPTPRRRPDEHTNSGELLLDDRRDLEQSFLFSASFSPGFRAP